MKGTTPRESWLNRILTATPAAVMALAATMMGFALGPSSFGYADPLFYAMAGGFYGGVALIVAVPVAWGFHALNEARRAKADATRLVMGEARTTVVKRAAWRGARHGAVAAGIGIPTGVVGNLAAYRDQVQGLIPAGLLTVGALTAALVVIALMAGIHTLWALRRTRGSTTSAMSTAYADEPTTSSPRTRRARIVWWGLAALVAVLPLWHRVSPLPDNGRSVWIIVKNVSVALLVVALVVIATRIAALLSRRARRRAVELLRRGNSLRAARTLAADSLSRNSQHTRRAASITATLFALAAFATTWTAADSARAALHGSLTAPLAVTAYDATPRSNFDRQSNPALGPEGYAPEVLSATYLDTLRSNEKLVVVPFALLRDTPYPYELVDEFGESSTTNVEQESLLVIDPAAADAVSPHLLARLAIEGSTYVTGWGTLSQAAATGQPRSFAGVELGLQSMWLGEGHAMVSTQGIAHALGTPPVNGVLVFPADAGVDVAVEVAQSDPPPTATLLEPDNVGPPNSSDSVAVMMAGFALLVSAPFVAAVAVVSSRLRRGEHATMAALGAARQDLRWVPPIEAGVVGFTSAIAGIVVGVVAALAASDPIAWMPGAAVTLSGLVWRLIDAVAATPWAVLALMVLLGAVVPAAVSALVTWRSADASPVEQLREAIREGAL